MLELLQYLGKFHPVILHLPIGALYFTFCLALADKYFKDNFSVPIRIGLFFSFVSAVISCLLGFFLSLSFFLYRAKFVRSFVFVGERAARERRDF